MSDPIILNDADQEEWEDYDKIKVLDGLVLDGQSKIATEHIERAHDIPLTMIDTPIPNKAWLGIASRIMRLMRSTQSAALRESRSWAWKFCMVNFKSGVEGRRPAHEQFTFADMLRATSRDGSVDTNATRCLGDAMYLFMQNEYLGRQVG